jgi:hypothetical protein
MALRSRSFASGQQLQVRDMDQFSPVAGTLRIRPWISVVRTGIGRIRRQGTYTLNSSDIQSFRREGRAGTPTWPGLRAPTCASELIFVHRWARRHCSVVDTLSDWLCSKSTIYPRTDHGTSPVIAGNHFARRYLRPFLPPAAAQSLTHAPHHPFHVQGYTM